MSPCVSLTFEGPQHGLKVGMPNQRGGGLQGERLLEPIQQSDGNFHREAVAPLGEHRHCVHQCALMD